ncbi:tyrosine-type recombinase/integrase [uncultured Sutterella sp.]|uniref:tyrosine-type recombinase/integrase n=1 Tax=uncultured Sutterella sp. TaxID=286133 RepID=UPI00261CBA00|nr:tyrosine-type recombinase/integrase [uncultured Sutterella sp.]
MSKLTFSALLQRFFINYLPMHKGASNQTIDSYRYAFIIFLRYVRDVIHKKQEKIEIKDFNYETIYNFLEWLETNKKNSPSTRNSRKAALDSFARFVMCEYPDHSAECLKILSIPHKKFKHKEISYLKPDGVKLFLDQVDISKRSGLKIYTMLTIMYSTGIRVSELINIRVMDLRLDAPATLIVHGKGSKERAVPLLDSTLNVLKHYLNIFHLENIEDKTRFCFLNHSGNPFTRQGIAYHIRKLADKARKINPDIIPSDLSPHKIRHTTAMNLLASGVELIYIRDLLGHSSVTSTEIYARVRAIARGQFTKSS